MGRATLWSAVLAALLSAPGCGGARETPRVEFVEGKDACFIELGCHKDRILFALVYDAAWPETTSGSSSGGVSDTEGYVSHLKHLKSGQQVAWYYTTKRPDEVTVNGAAYQLSDGNVLLVSTESNEVAIEQTPLVISSSLTPADKDHLREVFRNIGGLVAKASRHPERFHHAQADTE